MNHEEYNATIRQKMTELADTETIRKKKEINAEINEIPRMIQEQKASLDAAIATERYDDAVTAKAEISRLESKQEILMGVARELDARHIYDDKDLALLSDEVVNHYYFVLDQLYEDRLKILEKLEENYRMMEESKDSYSEIKSLIDSSASNSNYACNRTYAIPYSKDDCLNDPHIIKRRMQSIEEDLEKRGWQESKLC